MSKVNGEIPLAIPQEIGWGDGYDSMQGGDVALLADVDFGGDPLFELQALLADLHFDDKKAARDTRLTQEEAFREALAKSIEAMEERADAEMWSGIWGGIGQAAGGIASGLGGGGGTDGLLSNSKLAAMIRIGGALDQGMSSWAGGMYKKSATLAEADVARETGAKDTAERAIDDARDAASDAQDAFRKTIERFEEIIMAEEKVAQAAIRG